MAIVSNATESKKRDEYPKLMIGKQNQIVLMVAHGEGTLVRAGGNWAHNEIGTTLGNGSDYWIMDDFTDYHGTVTLYNQ